MRFLCALPVLASLALWARLQMAPEQLDLTTYLPKAPILLRAEILSVSSPPHSPFRQTDVATARLRVTRWYHGTPPPAVELRFAMKGVPTINGHNCFGFPPGTHWLILAKERDSALELIDDCYGAFRVSPELGAVQLDPMTQLEADFSAGLASTDRKHRILSLQRLANLHLAISRPALHQVIARGEPEETLWAAYAALRTGDISVIPTVRGVLEKEPRNWPMGVLAGELSRIKDPAAIPALTEIAWSQSDAAKASAITALGNIPSATSALPAITANLNSDNESIRRAARRAIAQLTNTPEPQ